jgi:hypothetical protein
MIPRDGARPRRRKVYRHFAIAMLVVTSSLGLAGAAQAQNTIPHWEIYGGFSEYIAKTNPVHGVEANLNRVVGVTHSRHRIGNWYLKIGGDFNAQFGDHVYDLAALPPGAIHVNSKALLGMFGPEPTFYGFHKFDLFAHFLVGLTYARDNEFPKIPTATYTTWAYGVGAGADLKISHQVSVRLFEFSWITTHFPQVNTEAQDNWRMDSGLVLRLGH